MFPLPTRVDTVRETPRNPVSCCVWACRCVDDAGTQGKPAAIARIRQRNPYNTVVMIGDGITDLEAVQVSGGADLFIGFGGVVERPAVAAEAEWYIYSYAQLVNALKRYKVGVVCCLERGCSVEATERWGG